MCGMSLTSALKAGFKKGQVKDIEGKTEKIDQKLKQKKNLYSSSQGVLFSFSKITLTVEYLVQLHLFHIVM